MTIEFIPYDKRFLSKMTQTWNDILIDGEAFPGEDLFNTEGFELMLLEQSATTCLLYNGVYAGFFIIHPNNIGRCAHTANASYCIDKRMRGKGLFKHVVKRYLWEAKQLGFQGMQFNAVVSNNTAAIHTYEINGFSIIGSIPKGFRLRNGIFTDMYIMHRSL